MVIYFSLGTIYMAAFFFPVIACNSWCRTLQVEPCVTYQLPTSNPIRTYDIISCKRPQSRMRTYGAYSHFPMGNVWERMRVALRRNLLLTFCFGKVESQTHKWPINYLQLILWERMTSLHANGCSNGWERISETHTSLEVTYRNVCMLCFQP